MFIAPYYREENHRATFTRQQASDFAKNIADDFNPLHDIDAKRFCVPGDLLFSMVLAKYGITRHMRFSFLGMVTEDVTLSLPEDASLLSITGDNGKEYLSVEHSGENSRDSELIDKLTASYVTFSGHTFPHLLAPLLEEQGVMFDVNRPMVIYQSMLIDLDRLDLTDVQLKFDREKTRLDVNGKRGQLCLAFELKVGDEVIGRGEKHMVVSGLRPFEKTAVDKFITDYNQWKRDFKG